MRQTNVDGENLPVELQPPDQADAARSDTMPLDYRDAGGRHVDGSKKTNETMDVVCEPPTLPRGPYGGHVISRDCPRFVTVAIVTVTALVAFDLLPAMSSANSWTQVSNTARVVNGTTTFVSVARFRGWATWSCLLLGLTAALLAQFFLLRRTARYVKRLRFGWHVEQQKYRRLFYGTRLGMHSPQGDYEEFVNSQPLPMGPGSHNPLPDVEPNAEGPTSSVERFRRWLWYQMLSIDQGSAETACACCSSE